jgi:hypothetical protein
MLKTPVRLKNIKLKNVLQNLAGNSWIKEDIPYYHHKIEVINEYTRLKSRPADLFPIQIKNELEKNWKIAKLQRQHHLTVTKSVCESIVMRMLQYPCSIDEIDELNPLKSGFDFSFFVESQIYDVTMSEKALLYRFYQWPNNVNYRHHREYKYMFPTRIQQFGNGQFYKIISNSENREFLIDRMIEAMRHEQPIQVKQALIERGYSNGYFILSGPESTRSIDYPNRKSFLNYHSLILEKLFLKKNFESIHERAIELDYLGIRDRNSLGNSQKVPVRSPAHANDAYWGLGCLEICQKLFEAYLDEDNLDMAIKLKDDCNLSDQFIRPYLAKFYFKNGENRNVEKILEFEKKSTKFTPQGDELHSILLKIFEAASDENNESVMIDILDKIEKNGNSFSKQNCLDLYKYSKNNKNPVFIRQKIIELIQKNNFKFKFLPELFDIDASLSISSLFGELLIDGIEIETLISQISEKNSEKNKIGEALLSYEENSKINPMTSRDQGWVKGDAPDIFTLPDQEKFYFELPNHEAENFVGFSYYNNESDQERPHYHPKIDRLGFSN